MIELYPAPHGGAVSTIPSITITNPGRIKAVIDELNRLNGPTQPRVIEMSWEEIKTVITLTLIGNDPHFTKLCNVWLLPNSIGGGVSVIEGHQSTSYEGIRAVPEEQMSRLFTLLGATP